jgi:hypothetical protein
VVAFGSLSRRTFVVSVLVSQRVQIIATRQVLLKRGIESGSNPKAVAAYNSILALLILETSSQVASRGGVESSQSYIARDVHHSLADYMKYYHGMDTAKSDRALFHKNRGLGAIYKLQYLLFQIVVSAPRDFMIFVVVGAALNASALYT